MDGVKLCNTTFGPGIVDATVANVMQSSETWISKSAIRINPFTNCISLNEFTRTLHDNCRF